MAVVVAVLVVVFGVWIIKDTVFQTRPDVQIAYVGTSDLPTDTVTALQDALTPFCSDLNGDGRVVVQVDSYTVDFDAANESTHEEAQRGRRNGRQHHERQTGQHLGCTQGQRLNEQGSPEKNGALEHEGLSD